MSLAEDILQTLNQQLPEAQVKIQKMSGSGDHFHLEILVASDRFQGLPLLQQHRAVMDVLKSKFEEGLHAVKIKTMTLQQYQNGEN